MPNIKDSVNKYLIELLLIVIVLAGGAIGYLFAQVSNKPDRAEVRTTIDDKMLGEQVTVDNLEKEVGELSKGFEEYKKETSVKFDEFKNSQIDIQLMLVRISAKMDVKQPITVDSLMEEQKKMNGN